MNTNPIPSMAAHKTYQARKPKYLRIALLLTLLIIGVHAGLNSAAFMAPGGAIIGWSQNPPSHCTLCHLPQSLPNTHLTPASYAMLLTQHLTLDQALGQMMIGQFVGQSITPEAIQMLDTQSLGGVILYADNINSASQIQAMNKQLQQVASIPLFITVDQEGGTVNRLQNLVGPLPAAANLTTTQRAYAQGERDANLLLNLGFNLNLAPVVDVGTSNPQLADRTFGSTPNRVADLAGAYLEGLQNGQITGCLKHFPGLGATTTDPHLGMPILNRSKSELEQIDMQPYRLLLKSNDIRAIMVSHEMIPSVDAQLPTSLSPAVINGLLRDELGYNGVVITDSLTMDAISARWSIPEASLRAIKAGADIVSGLDNPQIIQQTIDTLKDAVSAGALTRQRVNASVQRILTLKIHMGLIPMPKQPAEHQPPSTPPTTNLHTLQIGKTPE
jgi:beta-N-acetylhexosaminidase